MKTKNNSSTSIPQGSTTTLRMPMSSNIDSRDPTSVETEKRPAKSRSSREIWAPEGLNLWLLFYWIYFTISESKTANPLLRDLLVFFAYRSGSYYEKDRDLKDCFLFHCNVCLLFKRRGCNITYARVVLCSNALFLLSLISVYCIIALFVCP